MEITMSSLAYADLLPEFQHFSVQVDALIRRDAELYIENVVPVLEGTTVTPPLSRGWAELREMADEIFRALDYIWDATKVLAPVGELSEQTRHSLFLLWATFFELKDVDGRADLLRRPHLSPASSHRIAGVEDLSSQF